MRNALKAALVAVTVAGATLAGAAPASATPSGCSSASAAPNGVQGGCSYGPGFAQLHLICTRPGYANKSGMLQFSFGSAGSAGYRSYYCPSTAWSRAEGWMTWSNTQV